MRLFLKFFMLFVIFLHCFYAAMLKSVLHVVFLANNSLFHIYILYYIKKVATSAMGYTHMSQNIAFPGIFVLRTPMLYPFPFYDKIFVSLLISGRNKSNSTFLSQQVQQKFKLRQVLIMKKNALTSLFSFHLLFSCFFIYLSENVLLKFLQIVFALHWSQVKGDG